jgi:hypothetical protein
VLRQLDLRGADCMTVEDAEMDCAQRSLQAFPPSFRRAHTPGDTDVPIDIGRRLLPLRKWLRLASVNHVRDGTAVGKLEGDLLTVQGYYNVCHDAVTRQDLSRGFFFDQDPASLRKVMPVASGGIHAGPDAPVARLAGFTAQSFPAAEIRLEHACRRPSGCLGIACSPLLK